MATAATAGLGSVTAGEVVLAAAPVVAEVAAYGLVKGVQKLLGIRLRE